MKIACVKVTVYSMIVTGALIAFSALLIPSLSGYISLFAYIGGTVVACGLIFCILVMRIPECPYCYELFNNRDQSPESCPHCKEKINK